jgi:hypothetical protein
VLLPGGFGTMDEAFELLTLLQTGKAQPAPVVLLDTPGGTYWEHWCRFIDAEMGTAGYISDQDFRLLKVTDSVDVAVDEVLGFYANFHSQRFVDGKLVLRVHELPDDATLVALNREFADIVVRGEIEPIPTTRAELEAGDHVDLARLAFRFDRHGWARLRVLIDRLNGRD